MPIEFRCIQCNKLLRTADTAAGKKAKCPDCGQVLRVPSPEAAAAGDPSPPVFDPGAAAPPVTPSPAAPAAAPAGELGRGKLDMGDIFSRTWEIFKTQMGNCIVVPLVAGLLITVIVGIAVGIVAIIGMVSGLLAGALGIVLYLAAIVGSIWIGIGLAGFFLKIARGQPAGLGDVFNGDFGLVLPLFLGGLLLNVVVGIGMLLLIVPGVILALMFSQFQLLVIDRRMGVMDAMKASNDLMKGNKLTLFLILLVAGLGGGLISALTLGIGSLFVNPFMVLMMVVIYLTVTGQSTAGDGQ